VGLRGSAFFDNQDFPDCQYSLLIASVEALREECLLLSMNREAMLAFGMMAGQSTALSSGTLSICLLTRPGT